MKRLLPDLVKHGGYCCEHMYLREMKRWPTGLLSRWLGVGVRTIREWKSRYRKGATSCEYRRDCQENRGREPPRHPLLNPQTRSRFDCKDPDNV